MKGKMKRQLLFRLMILTLFLFGATKVAAQEIVIATARLNSDAFLKWTEETPCEKLKDYKSPYSFRQSVEIVLICKALHIGGLKPIFKFVDTPNYSRALREVELGRATLPSQTVWQVDVDEDSVFVSDAIIQDGEFVKGFYTRIDKRKVIEQKLLENNNKQITALQTLRGYRVISSESWVVDWATIQKMKFDALSTNTLGSMCKMIDRGRAELLLGEFKNTANLNWRCEGVSLVPVRGIKIGLIGSRHFVVSKNYPNSEKIYQALQKGVQQLRRNGEIQDAFVQSGFYNKAVKDWNKVF